MRINRLAFLAAAGLTVFSGIALANINIKVTHQAKAGIDQCNQFVGPWNGEGVIETVCKYSGTADVFNDSTQGHYKIIVNVTHDSGYFWCPDPKPFTLSATCFNSHVEIETNSGTNVSGATDGHTVNLSGEIVLDSGQKVTLNSLTLKKR